jgi:hypothetical protein
MAMTDPVPHAMYQAVTDKLTGEIRENLQLRAEVIALTVEVARLNGELAGMFAVDPADGKAFEKLFQDMDGRVMDAPA